MQTFAIEADDPSVLFGFHPKESSGLVVEAARLDDFKRAGMLGPHRPKQQRTILRRQSRDKVASKSLDALQRPGVVIALRAALLALPAVYRVPEIVTRGRFPDGGESDSTWRTQEARHVGSDTIAPGFDAPQVRGLARKTKDGP